MVEGLGELRTSQRNVAFFASFAATVTLEGETTNAGASAWVTKFWVKGLHDNSNPLYNLRLFVD